MPAFCRQLEMRRTCMSVLVTNHFRWYTQLSWFRGSSWLLNWYVSLSLYKQALGRNQWILLYRSPNGATRRTPRLMELLTHDWTTTTTWREPFSIHTFIEHGILFNNAGISFPFHPTHSSWIWHNELFNSFCISTGWYWKIVVLRTWNW